MASTARSMRIRSREKDSCRDMAIHSANLMGTLVANTPFLGKSLAGKILGGNPLTKRFAAIFQTPIIAQKSPMSFTTPSP